MGFDFLNGERRRVAAYYMLSNLSSGEIGQRLGISGGRVRRVAFAMGLPHPYRYSRTPTVAEVFGLKRRQRRWCNRCWASMNENKDTDGTYFSCPTCGNHSY